MFAHPIDTERATMGIINQKLPKLKPNLQLPFKLICYARAECYHGFKAPPNRT
jgi:hypothetical protein